MIRSAQLSPCKTYRYILGRIWDAVKPTATFIMLNPSTADAEVDDQTIRRCLHFAQALRCGQLYVVNAFAFRATDPGQLDRAYDPVGPDNDGWIEWALQLPGPAIAAWGGTLQYHKKRHARMLEILKASGREILCLKKTLSGEPNHPLYLKGTTKPVTFIGRTS